MKAFNGMNGHILVNAPSSPGLYVGRTNGEPYGYKPSLLVSVEFTVELLARQETYETVTHDRVAGPLDFTMTTSVWRPDRRDIVSGGASREPLRELATYSDGFNAENTARLADMGDRWHLNSMRAACAHMDTATLVREDNGYGGQRISTRAPENVCPVTGYQYGHAWLVEPLPAGFVAELLSLVAGADQSRIYRSPRLADMPDA